MHETKTFDKPTLKHLDLETSSICNLSCNFCPRPKENGTMPIDDIKRLIKEFADMGGETIKPFWRGEPTFDERMPEILKYAKDCGLNTMLNSNCSFKKNNPIQILQNTDWISFSIDEQHNNISEILTVVGIKSLMPKDKYIEVQASQINDYVEAILHIANIPYKVDLPTKRSDKDTTSEVITGERKYCKFPDWRMVVAYNGDCTICCVDWNMENKIGNIYENSLSDIFHSPLAYQIRQELKSDVYSSMICKQCPSRSSYK